MTAAGRIVGAICGRLWFGLCLFAAGIADAFKARDDEPTDLTDRYPGSLLHVDDDKPHGERNVRSNDRPKSSVAATSK